MGTLLIALQILGIIAGVLALAFVFELTIVSFIIDLPVPKQPLGEPGRPQGEPASRSDGRDVTFDVKGTRVHACLYLPAERSTPVPTIVMAHGLGGTLRTGLDHYASRFQAAGFAVLAFDYRHLGESDGEPRQLIWIPYQIEDYATAVSYVRSLPEIDPNKIALWGTSLSGGHVLVTAARDNNVSCVVAQCPFLNGNEASLELVKKIGFKQIFRMLPHGQRDLVRSWFGLSPHKIPLFGKTATIAVMADDGAWNTFAALVPDDFANEACARITIRLDKYHPVDYISKVRCRVLLQITDDEARFQKKSISKVRKALDGRVEVIRYPIGHFDVYTGEHLDRCVNDQIAFFKKHLDSQTFATRAQSKLKVQA